MSTSTRGAVLAGITSHPAAADLVLDIYAADGARVGRILNPSSVTLVERRLAVSTATVVLADDPAVEPYVGLLRQPGARVHVHDHLGYVLGGPVVSRAVDRAARTLTVAVEDYLRVFVRTLGIPVPGGTLAQQHREYWTLTGPAETVVKRIARENFDRLGVPVQIPADLGRGGRLQVAARMDRLSDVLFEALAANTIEVRVRPVGTEQRMTGLSLDVTVPPDYPVPINDSSDVLADWSITDTEPEATRVIMGGGGEGVERDFYGRVDAAREAERGGAIAIGEVFVDRRDIRADVDAALRDRESAYESREAARARLREAQIEQRITFIQGRADVAEVDAEETFRRGEAYTDLVEARAEQDRLPADATQAQKQAAQDKVNASIDAYRAAGVRRSENIAAAKLRRDENNAAADQRVAEAQTAFDEAAAALNATEVVLAAARAALTVEIDTALTAALVDGGPKVSASVVLAETASFQWDGDAIQIGTRLRLSLGGFVIYERIRERRRVYTAAGVESVPVIGERELSPDVRATKYLAALAKRVRALSAR